MGRAGDYLRDEKSPDNKEKFGNPKSVEEIVEALRKLDGKQARNEEEPGQRPVTRCRDCGIEISEFANHTGHETWCEDCFDEGLSKDMDDHWKNYWAREMGKTVCKHGNSDPMFCKECNRTAG